jgi:hypothetical protein
MDGNCGRQCKHIHTLRMSRYTCLPVNIAMSLKHRSAVVTSDDESRAQKLDPCFGPHGASEDSSEFF